jgi:hypothetical protein
LQQVISRQIVRHHIAQIQAFRGRVLDVTHIEIEPAAVEQETAIAGRFLVIPIMQVDRADLSFSKKEILYPDWPGIGMAAPFLACDEAAIFSFDAGNAIHHINSS